MQEIFLIILKTLILILIGFIDWYLLESNFNKDVKFSSKIEHICSDKIENNGFITRNLIISGQRIRLFSYGIIAIGILFLILLPLNSSDPLFYSRFSLIFIILTIVFLSFGEIVMFTLIRGNLMDSSSIISRRFVYSIFPIILSITSNILLYFIVIFRNEGFEWVSFRLSYGDLIDFQKENYMPISSLPALFVLLNPISFLSYIFAIYVYFRDILIELREIIPLESLDPKIKSFRIKIFSYLSIMLLLFMIPFITLYFGIVINNSNYFLNVLVIGAIVSLFIIAFSFMGRYKRKIFLEKKLGSVLRFPMLLSLIGIIVSIFVGFTINF